MYLESACVMGYFPHIILKQQYKFMKALNSNSLKQFQLLDQYIQVYLSGILKDTEKIFSCANYTL